MKIHEIKKTKTGKYKVHIDDQVLIMYDDVLLKNGLLYKKEIDPLLYEQIIKDNIYYEAYNKTLTYILKKVRCTLEVEKYLNKFPIDNKDKIKIINHLKAIGILNDRNYAKAFISDSLFLTNDGPIKIKEHLIKCNISEMIIEEEISKIDLDIVEQKLIKLIDKRIKVNNKLSVFKMRQKIMRDMLNLGYDKDLIESILSGYQISDDSQLLHDYQKFYTQLSKKYEGYELSSKIRQKLYYKGFELNKINELLQEKEDEF